MVYRFIGRRSASTREGDEAPLPPFNPPSTPPEVAVGFERLGCPGDHAACWTHDRFSFRACDGLL